LPLTSELFKNDEKLQKCSLLDSAHIVAAAPPFQVGTNDQGSHIALIHTALREVMPGASFGLEEATETYGPKTAEVVRQFKAKQNPPILNKALGQRVPDNIVGKLTIAALDAQVGRKKPPSAPPAPPAPPQTDATEKRMVFKKTFEERFIVRNAGDLGSDLATLGEVILQAGKDIPRLLKNPIESTDFDDGRVQESNFNEILTTHVMRFVNVEVEVRRLPNFVALGVHALQMDITRTYNYSYGQGGSSDTVVVVRKATLLNFDLRGSRQVLNETRRCSQPSNFLDPR
jgi:peptidoglycan hydrolase-like protein with peptidoglycan-binding domain